MYHYNDGGRTEAGYKGYAGDCVVRSVAIVTGRPYQTVYEELTAGNVTERKSRIKTARRLCSAREGVHTGRKWFKDYMTRLGFTWTPTMGIGTGCTVHLKAEELPKGRLVASLSKHMVAVIDGMVNDVYDPSRGGTRCVYGYWMLKG